MVWTNLDRQAVARMHTGRNARTYIVVTMSPSPQAHSTKKGEDDGYQHSLLSLNVFIGHYHQGC